MSRTQGKRLTSWDRILKDDSLTAAAGDLPAPEVVDREIIGELELALDEFGIIMAAQPSGVAA